MKNLFAPYEIALALKNLGFDEPCCKGYTEEYKQLINFVWDKTNTTVQDTLPTGPLTAPTIQQVFQWFRDGHYIYGSVNTSGEYIKGVSKYKVSFQYTIAGFGIKGASTAFKKKVSKIFDTFEVAELECIKSMIEIVQKKK